MRNGNQGVVEMSLFGLLDPWLSSPKKRCAVRAGTHPLNRPKLSQLVQAEASYPMWCSGNTAPPRRDQELSRVRPPPSDLV